MPDESSVPVWCPALQLAVPWWGYETEWRSAPSKDAKHIFAGGSARNECCPLGLQWCRWLSVIGGGRLGIAVLLNLTTCGSLFEAFSIWRWDRQGRPVLKHGPRSLEYLQTEATWSRDRAMKVKCRLQRLPTWYLSVKGLMDFDPWAGVEWFECKQVY